MLRTSDYRPFQPLTFLKSLLNNCKAMFQMMMLVWLPCSGQALGVLSARERAGLDHDRQDTRHWRQCGATGGQVAANLR